MRLVFGAIVAFVLLSLYAASVMMGIAVVLRVNDTAGADRAFTEGMRLAMTTIGGLVSTLVVTALANTRPGESPLERFRGDLGAEIKYENILNYSIIAYVIIWIILGLA